ncbi:MAG: ribosomal biogenesis protein [Candidatus Thermoplasmatota archaeon]
MILVTKWFGAFVLDKDGNVIAKRLFPSNPHEIASRLAAMREGELLQEESDLSRAHPGVTVVEHRLSGLGILCDTAVPHPTPSEHGFELSLLREAMLLLARSDVRRAVGLDAYLIQALGAYDDLVRHKNDALERLREWHGIYFPELPALMGDEKYLDVVSEGMERSTIIKELGVTLDSIGADCREVDMQAMRALAYHAKIASQSKNLIEMYVRLVMLEIAPNISKVTGELLGARLLALAGGLGRMAKMPSSTIQILGAEKAFFRHVKEGTSPPKHGVLFQHPLVHRAPSWQRGRIARLLANKIALAARADFFGGREIGDKLVEEIRSGVEEIERRYPTPPKKRRKGGRTKRRST